MPQKYHGFKLLTLREIGIQFVVAKSLKQKYEILLMLIYDPRIDLSPINNITKEPK